MRVLSADDLAFFEKNGYVVVHDAVPPENVKATVAALWEFLGVNPDDPSDWYRPPVLTWGNVEIYQHQALWDNRQFPRLHQAFADIYGTEKLLVSFDRASLKLPYHPDHPEYDHKGFTHWDCDSKNPPKERFVQGVLYLADTAANQGGFQCVPELYQQFAEWVKTQPEDRDPHLPDLTGFEVTPIPGKAGDLIIWDMMLAHGNGRNMADKPRLAQYITMYPPHRRDEAEIAERVRQWREHSPPGNKTFPGDSRKIEEQFGKTAELTPLGRKLLGLDLWE